MSTFLVYPLYSLHLIPLFCFQSAGGDCQQTWENMGFCFGIYFSYFLLFCNFFYHAYLKKNNRYTAAVPSNNNGKKIGEKTETVETDVLIEKVSSW